MQCCSRVQGLVVCSEREKDTVMVMRRVVTSYFSIVRNTMKDLVPKVIMRFVVNHTVETIHGHLISKILRHALRLDLLGTLHPGLQGLGSTEPHKYQCWHPGPECLKTVCNCHSSGSQNARQLTLHLRCLPVQHYPHLGSVLFW